MVPSGIVTGQPAHTPNISSHSQPLYKAKTHSVAVHNILTPVSGVLYTGVIVQQVRSFCDKGSFLWKKSREGNWNDVPDIRYNDTQTKHIKSSSLVGHEIFLQPFCCASNKQTTSQRWMIRDAHILNQSFFGQTKNQRNSTHLRHVSMNLEKLLVTNQHMRVYWE